MRLDRRIRSRFKTPAPWTGFPHISITSPTLLIFASLILNAAPLPDRYVSTRYPHALNTNLLPITLEVQGEVPEFVAVNVRPKPDKSREQAFENYRAALKTNRNARLSLPSLLSRDPDSSQWIPFQTNLLIDLGPGEGERQIMFAYKYKGQAFNRSWSGSTVNIQRGAPTLRIVSPTNFLSSQPMIHLQGLTSRKFDKLRFDRFDSRGNKFSSEGPALGTSFPGGYEFKYTENYFSFVDVDLSPGTNNFVFHGTDEFGNEMTTNIVIVFSTAHDHTPPKIEVGWPRPNAELTGPEYMIQGRMDDFTANLKARIRTKDGWIDREALVERNGYFWIENIPLALDANQITLTAVDAAGNTSGTNFTVTGHEGPIVTMNPVNPPDLWRQFVTVTGRVTSADHDVWINGVKAKVEADGTWSSERVPILSPSGGTAIFEMSAVPRTASTATKARVADVVSAQASLSTNAILLNASTPVCGLFRLHISETEGKSFVILASTNLTEWTAILTNMNSAAGFDYALATTNHACRFFKLVPLP